MCIRDSILSYSVAKFEDIWTQNLKTSVSSFVSKYPQILLRYRKGWVRTISILCFSCFLKAAKWYFFSKMAMRLSNSWYYSPKSSFVFSNPFNLISWMICSSGVNSLECETLDGTITGFYIINSMLYSSSSSSYYAYSSIY